MSDLIDVTRIDSSTVEKLTITDDEIITARTYNYGQVLKDVANMRSEPPKHKDAQLVASIPLELIYHWKMTEGFDWFKATDTEKRAKLNDPDNGLFRVQGGRL